MIGVRIDRFIVSDERRFKGDVELVGGRHHDSQVFPETAEWRPTAWDKNEKDIDSDTSRRSNWTGQNSPTLTQRYGFCL